MVMTMYPADGLYCFVLKCAHIHEDNRNMENVDPQIHLNLYALNEEVKLSNKF